MNNVYMCDAVRDVRELYQAAPISKFKTTFDLLRAYASILFDAYRSQNAVVKFQISCWHPQLVGKPLDEIFAYEFSLDDARLTLAREFGFESVEDAQAKSTDFNQEFESCIDLCLAGEVEQVKALLGKSPGLVERKSSFGHDAQLLHYLGSNGVETWRQVVPRNIVEVAKLLLESGADSKATMKVYGGQFDTIAMVDSSAHPAAAGVADSLLAVLRGSADG